MTTRLLRHRVEERSYVDLEARVPEDHPLRPMRALVDNALQELSPLFEEI